MNTQTPRKFITGAMGQSREYHHHDEDKSVERTRRGRRGDWVGLAWLGLVADWKVSRAGILRESEKVDVVPGGQGD